MSEQAVLDANDAFYRAFNQKDFEAMDRLWARRAPVACIHPGWNILRGREAVMQSWQGILGNPGQPRIVNGGSEAHLLGEVAYVTCRELVAGSPLAATNVFVLEDGEWRIVHHHSSPVAGAGT
jgi:ketosteroid isomerase-like protein